MLTDPGFGTATVDNNNDITYTPEPLCCDSIAPQKTRTDTFTYTVIDYLDDNLVSNEATVTIIVDCARGDIQANDDYEETDEDEEVTVYPLTNDEDSENQPLQLTNVGPVNGPGTATQKSGCKW